jgi:serine/threonine protein kinase/GTPase Era involved in 16S rRNA processing
MADDKVDLKIDGITGERLVRRGDHTELYQATQKQFGRKVAVKVYTADGMRDTALARFERECALMGELTGHPNVVTYFKSGVRRRRPYVVTEWLEEGTYSALLRKGRTLDWADAVNLGIKVCGALESAHRLGLVHRKIKPEDLFVSAFGEPLLGDFQLDPSEGSRSGDPYEIMVHAAPELFRGAAAHPQMDVYALASVIHTLIRGVPPFLEEPDEPLVRIKGRALSVPPPDLRTLGVPAPVHAVLWWGLQPSPEHRPVSAMVFGRALQAALSASGRAPAKMLIRPQIDQDRALPEPTLPAAAMALITDAAAAPTPAPARVATPTVPPPAAPPAAMPTVPPPTAPPTGARPPSVLPPPTAPTPAATPPPAAAPSPPPPAAPPTPPTPPSPAAPPPRPAPAPVPAMASAEPVRERSDASMSPVAVVERVRALLRMARQAYSDPLERDRIDDLERRLDEPLRVAIAGKVKAGKSTLLNGLVGEELAPTDASECTRIVTWYVDGLTYRATMHLHDGRQVVTPFSRQSGAIDVDLQGYPADRVAEIRVEWPSSSLNELSLIDTPGIASISTDLSARTHQFVLAEADHESKADAVVYLMRHLHPTDIRFLESFQDTQAGRTNPINAIGVLSRADELAGAQDTALQSAARVAARYRNSPQVRRLCQTVVPVAGLLAQASATLRQSEYNLLARIAALPTDQLDVLTASADRFVDHDLVANVVSTDREQLLRRLGLFGVRQALIAIRNGTVDDAPSLAQHLFEQSGLAELRRVLTTQFAARRDVLKSQAALQALAQRLRISPPQQDADRLQFEIERLRSTAHVFNEIQLFAAIRSGAVGFTDGEMEAVECLLGSNGYDPTTRLGLDPAAPPEDIVGELNDRIRHWRARAENPLSSRELSDAAQVLVRTCEGMLRAMQVDQVA